MLMVATMRLRPPWQVPAGEGSGGLDCAAFLREREEEEEEEEGFVERVRRLGGALAGGVGKLGVQAACFVDFFVHDDR